MAMIAAERRAAAGLAGIYALRMLGLFIVLPVLALAARDLDAASPVLIGLALGIYGLTQAALQVPFGLLSDRFGRKRIILAGLILFALGSALCALADSIWGIILGRALQGAGAIAAALMALAADLTRDAVRSRIMAVIGVSIGFAFALSLLVGPLVHGWLGLDGLFWLTTGFALGAIALLYTVVPEPRSRQPQRDASPAREQLRAVLSHRGLLRLDLGIFVLHCVMTATFVVLPLAIEDAGLAGTDHWQMYLPVLTFSVLLMLPLLILGERTDRAKTVFLTAIALVACGQFGMALAGFDVLLLSLALLVFFTGFNLLEAVLPARVSRLAPAAHKGTAMGVYASAQFLGAFVGGLLAGVIQQVSGMAAVFTAMAALGAVWWLASLGMPRDAPLASVLVRLGDHHAREPDAVADRLAGVAGVDEVVVVSEERVAYLKVDRANFDPADVRSLGLDVTAGAG